MRATDFMTAYRRLLQDIFDDGTKELNERTGVQILMLEGGTSFKIEFDAFGFLPVCGNRKMFPHIAAAETAWQFMGTQEPEWILSKAPKIWQDFVEDGKLKTAYGYRWRGHFGRDQISMAVAQLRDNPTNRQLYVSAWDPMLDGLGAPDQPKNIPCPVGFSVSASGEDRMHGSVFIRSSDVFVGLPYDVMGYALTLSAMAKSAGRRLCSLHVTLAHPHIYEPHWKFVEASLYKMHWVHSTVMMPDWTVEQIVRDPDGYVDVVKRMGQDSPMHEWNPMPEVVV